MNRRHPRRPLSYWSQVRADWLRLVPTSDPAAIAALMARKHGKRWPLALAVLQRPWWWQ